MPEGNTVSAVMSESLADHHTHAQEICVHDEGIARMFALLRGGARWSCPPAHKYVEHVVRNNLDTIWLIYEDIERFIEIRKAILSRIPHCRVMGYFFIRNPLIPDVNKIKKQYKSGLLHGIKLHPVNDNYLLLPQYVDPSIMIAQQLGIPVLYHSDDRAQTMHLTSPKNQQELVSTYPNVRFVIGHGGAYANPRLVGNSAQTRAYWGTRGPLVEAALLLSARKNVLFETSVTTNRIKAEIIASFLKEHPHVATRILVGTDFPIKSSQVKSQIGALKEAGLSSRLLSTIASNRL